MLRSPLVEGYLSSHCRKTSRGSLRLKRGGEWRGGVALLPGLQRPDMKEGVSSFVEKRKAAFPPL